jgi:hypothetical protein
MLSFRKKLFIPPQEWRDESGKELPIGLAGVGTE